MLFWISLRDSVVVGVVVGLVVHVVARGRKSKAVSALAGSVGAVVGRATLGLVLPWHPHILGRLIGATVLALIWVLATRSGTPSQLSDTA